ncbi:MAG: DsrE family protein [Sulfurovum sp.]|nr:DsrE family protein [Sulfurovum sp.]
MKNVFKIILSVMMFLGVANAAEMPYKGKKVVITLTSGDIMASGIGTALGLGAAKGGAEVTVIIGANSLKYVTKDGWAPEFPAKKKTIKEILQKMVEAGTKIFVCGMCAKVNGLAQSDFIKGAVISKPGPILDAMLDDVAKTFEY